MSDLGSTGLSGGLADGSGIALLAFPGNRAVAGSTVQGNPSPGSPSTFRGNLVANALAGALGTAGQTRLGQLVALAIVAAGNPATLLARHGNLTSNETAFALTLELVTALEPLSFQHQRNLLFALSLDLLHFRTILASSPPLPSIVHTRSIFRSFLPMIHRRTIVPRSVILNAGLVESGEAQGGTLTTVILAPDASTTNGFYVGMWITIGGEERLITAYNGMTKTATVAALTSPPTAGTPYSITVSKPGTSKVLRPFAQVTET